MKLQGQVAIVTGAGNGQGRAVSLKFAREGAKVAIVDVEFDAAQETLRQVQKAGGDGLAIKCDVSKEPQVKRAVERTVEKFGRVDILYNNAGAFQKVGDSVDAISEANWHRVLNVNVTGTLLFSKHCIPHMKKAGGGKIVNVASTLGLMSSPGFAAYSTSKHGEVGLTKQMALEYGKFGIRVNAICPGTIDTRMLVASGVVGERRKQMAAGIPLRRIGTPDDIASVALFFASNDSSFVSGCHLPVDGGNCARWG